MINDGAPERDVVPADVRALIVRRLAGAPLLGRIVYTYGSAPEDAELVPTPNHTTILVASMEQAYWFDIDVREIDPANPTQAYRLDPDMLISLARRAGLPSPRSW